MHPCHFFQLFEDVREIGSLVSFPEILSTSFVNEMASFAPCERAVRTTRLESLYGGQFTFSFHFCLCTQQHWWFSSRILACHAGGPGSIPGQCNCFFYIFCIFFFFFFFFSFLSSSLQVFRKILNHRHLLSG